MTLRRCHALAYKQKSANERPTQVNKGSKALYVLGGLITYWCLLLTPLSQVGAAPPSFVGINLHGDYAAPNFKDAEHATLPLFRQAGVTNYGQNRVSWSIIEPTPPSQGVHSYNWQTLDTDVTAVEAVGGRLHPDVICNASWAVELNTDTLSSPPKDDATCATDNPDMGMSCWDAWQDFIRALVERYDNDGIDDMPGLEYSHLYWQIGTEYENTEQWNTAGTDRAERYVALLHAAHEAAEQANSNVQVISFSFSFGDAFDNNPTVADFNAITDPYAVVRREFTAAVLTQGANDFDMVGTNANFHYNGIPARVKWIRSLSTKPIWIDSAAPAHVLTRGYLQPPLYDETVYPYKTETEIGEILVDGTHPEHLTIKKWWEAQKAKYTFKKAVISTIQTVEGASFEFIFDCMGRNIFWGTIGEMAYSYTLGLLEGGFGPEPRGTPKPVYHTLKLFNEKVGNADAVTDLNPLPEGTDPTNWTWMTKFRKNDQDILVLWVEGGGQPTVDLTPHFPTSTVKITQIVTALDDNNRPIYPEPIEVPTNAVPVDNTPVFIEIPSTVTDPVCECELVPEEYVIPRGSSSTFEAILTNNSAQAQELYFATKVGVPRADQFVLYPQIGYLRGPYRVTLNPNESKSSDLGLSVPNSALPAIYKYIGYIGTPEAGFYDICHFDFQVPIEETDITWPQTDSPW